MLATNYGRSHPFHVRVGGGHPDGGERLARPRRRWVVGRCRPAGGLDRVESGDRPVTGSRTGGSQ